MGRAVMVPPAVADEHDLYPVHEEDSVPQRPLREMQTRHLQDALEAHLPDKWITGDVCMYWEPGNFHQYAAPDVLVVEGARPDPVPPVHLRWADPPALLVVEIGSRSTFTRDQGPELEIYGLDLGVPEYLYYHPTRHDLRFYCLGVEGYDAVRADARGWVHSETLDVFFGVDDTGELRAYTPDGQVLLTNREAEARTVDAERRLAELEDELRRLRAGKQGSG